MQNISYIYSIAWFTHFATLCFCQVLAQHDAGTHYGLAFSAGEKASTACATKYYFEMVYIVMYECNPSTKVR